MKILLLNDNPVVDKLVTLSAQKSSDELDIVSSIEDITESSYDLVVVDDGIGGDEVLECLKEKLIFAKALYIRSRDTKDGEQFDSILKKPFLPTDLVELFVMFDNEIKKDLDSGSDTLESIDEFEDIALDEQIDLDMEALEIEKEGADDDITLELDEEEDNILIDDESLDDEELGESVLDNEEAQKVKDLLDETSDLAFDEEEEVVLSEDELEAETAYDLALDLEDEADVDISEDESNEAVLELDEDEENENENILNEDELAYDEALDMEDEADVDISDDDLLILDESSDQESTQDDNTEDESESEELEIDSFEEAEAAEELEELEETEETEAVEDFEEPEELEEADKSEELDELENFEEVEELEEIAPENIEQRIQEAVEELSDEDLESELDDATLLEIAASEIDSLDNLSSKDLKLALGEEIEEDDFLDVSEEDVEELLEEAESEVQEETEEDLEEVAGVTALKKLLEALSDKDVVASMKGMKITINIELDSKQ